MPPHWFKYEWIWKKSRKTGFLNAKKQPLRNHESVLVFYNKQPVYNPQGVIAVNQMKKRGNSKDSVGTNYRPAGNEYFQETGNYPSSVLEIPNDRPLHPTAKPVALLEYLIKTYTNEGDLVLDNVAGSGTTGVAARNTNRNYLLIEREQKYYDIILERLNAVV